MEIVAGIAVCVVVVGVVLSLAVATRRQRQQSDREAALRQEFAAYARLDLTLAPGAPTRELARRVCATVAHHRAQAGSGATAALLLRDAELRLRVTGSAGFDDLTLLALDAWGERFAREQRAVRDTSEPAEARRSYTITVGPLEAFDRTRSPGPVGCRQIVVLPLWSSTAAMLGALTVASPGMNAAAAMPPLEALAANLARSIENASLSDRLLRAEKMAGLGQLAKGVAHELNNPLTAVLGLSELLAETAMEAPVREHAGLIAAEALRMRRTVESLLQFWRPVTPADSAVDLLVLLRRVQQRTARTFQRAGVEFLLQVDEELGTCCVRGHEERLLQVFEHLLRNAAEAVAREEAATAKPTERVLLPRPAGLDGLSSGVRRRARSDPHSGRFPSLAGERAVRMTLARERKTLQVVVSDTGPGFQEPARVFDPFYTTHAPREEGRRRPDSDASDAVVLGAHDVQGSRSPAQGMGLAISYGIVREHGGEISAFNLTPHGAAVVVELPLARTVRDSGDHAVAA